MAAISRHTVDLLMAATFVGCTACRMLLIVSDADGPARAHKAGWTLSESGWRCSKHAVEPLDDELVAELPPAAQAITAALSDVPAN